MTLGPPPQNIRSTRPGAYHPIVDDKKACHCGYRAESYTGEGRAGARKGAEPDKDVRVPECPHVFMNNMRQRVKVIRSTRQVWEKGTLRDRWNRTNPSRMAAPVALAMDQLAQHHRDWPRVVEVEFDRPSHIDEAYVWTKNKREQAQKDHPNRATGMESFDASDSWPLVDVTVKEILADSRCHPCPPPVVRPFPQQ